MDEFFSVDNLQRLKLIVHCTQAVFIFIAWCIMIGFFRNAVVVTGASGWYFALCFLTVPVIIYQTMTPMWERSRRWGNPYAFAIIDLVYTILWLSAFAAVANINTWGLCFGACDLSKAEVGLGFFIFLFFGITSAMSVYGVIYFRRNGALPGSSRMPTSAAMIDPDRDAFSTAPHDDEYAPVHMNDNDGHHEMDGSEAGHYDPVSYGDGGAGRQYMPPTVSDADTSYHSYGAEHSSHMGYGGDVEPERVQFPAGNYH